MLPRGRYLKINSISSENHTGVRQACFFGWVHLMEAIGSAGISQVMTCYH
jgi:hypothetical protein